MTELDPVFWESALATVRAIPVNTLFIQSVLCRHVDGRVFGNDPRVPTAFYAVHPYGMALLWGDDRDRGIAWLRDHLLATHDPVEWLQVFPDHWGARIEAVLGERLAPGSPAQVASNALKCTRVNFRFDREAYLEARREVAAALERATIVATTEEMSERTEGSVVPLRFWRDAAEFVRHGGGFTAIVDGEVASTAFCSFRHGTQLEIGVETAARHRGNGHARLVACALIDDCLRRGLEPVWACRLENVGSFRLATRLGFVPTVQLPYYRLPS